MEKVYRTELLEEYIKEHKISKKEFCIRAKISLYTLNKILNHNTYIGILTINRVAKLVGVRFVEFVTG